MPRKTVNPVPCFYLQTPPRTPRRVWVGFYSDMTGTVVMVFDRKPQKDSDGHYTVLTKGLVATVWADDWERWFGQVETFIAAGLIERRADLSCSAFCVPGPNPHVCDRVMEVEVFAAWDEDTGRLIGFDTNADN